MTFIINKIEDRHIKAVTKIIEKEWGSPVIVKGRLHYPEKLPGYIAENMDEIVGLITCHIEEDQCEIVTLNSFLPNRGIGSSLIKAVKKTAKQAGCRRLWLITTNDNIDAIRFYQMKGFNLSALYKGAVDESRKQKPEIPQHGCYGIPIHDEVELEMPL